MSSPQDPSQPKGQQIDADTLASTTNFKPKWSSRKMCSYILEYSALLPEFYIIGILHELGRQTIFYNANVNSPRVGDLVSLTFTFFYLARLIGMLFGLLFSLVRKYVEVTYYLGIPMCITLFIAGWFKGAFWLVMCRAMLGFFSAYAPVQCILRRECNKTQVIQQRIEFMEQNKEGDNWKKVSGIKTLLKRLLEFCFSMVAMLFTGILYSHKKMNFWRPSWIFGILVSCLFGWFFWLWKCGEPQYIPARYTDNQEEEEARESSDKRLGRFGKIFHFFFDDESLMLYTLSAKLFDAIRMVDFVFMLFMLQTHPFYKGLWLHRGLTVLYACLANFITHFGVFFIMEMLVTGKNALMFMRITSFSAILVWPILNTLVNLFNYKSASHWVYIVYIISEIIKGTMNYIMQEGLYEIIKKSPRASRIDRYRALGYFASDFFKCLSFMIFGFLITKFMRSYRIQKMNPYNYTISFLILCIPLLISWILLKVAIYEETDSENERKELVEKQARNGTNAGNPFDNPNAQDGADNNGADGAEWNPLFRGTN